MPGPADHTSLVNSLLVGLIVILISAKAGGEIFERFGQTAVLGELLVGVCLGNLGLLGIRGLGFLQDNQGIVALSELGVILLLFEVGLECNLQEMRQVGLSALLAASLGVLAVLGLGWGAARLILPAAPPLAHLFIGACLSATSVGISARVLRDLGQLQRPVGRIILGAAVVDDVMGLLVVAVLTGAITAVSGGGGWHASSLSLIVARAGGFLVGALAVGSYLSPRLFRLASLLQVQHMLLVTSLGLCFLLARLAASMGLAPIVGAFAAGLILDPVHYRDFTDRGEHAIEELIRPISGFLVPVFFVVIGMKVDLRALAEPRVLALAGALTLAAVLGKQACALGVVGRGLDRLSVGIGMIPRGEVSLILASMGLTLAVATRGGRPEALIGPETFSAVVVTVMATSLLTPPLLKWSLARRR
jgi:Kef-type K+ transport system membrane component KefB